MRVYTVGYSIFFSFLIQEKDHLTHRKYQSNVQNPASLKFQQNAHLVFLKVLLENLGYGF
jgi:hypothetical protein